MKLKTVSIYALSVITALGVLTGCGPNKTVSNENEPIKLTWWTQNNGSAYISDYGELEAFKKMQEDNHVEITFIHPVGSQVQEQFNVMIESGDYADIIDYRWADYQGGPAKAIANGIIIDLKDYIKLAPNFNRIIDSKVEFGRSLKNYDGSISVFPSIHEDIAIKAYYGPTIRKDWLDTLGLPVPVTIENWENVLKAFKEKDPNKNGLHDEVPLCADKGMDIIALAAAWGCIPGSFYQNAKGEFVYGSMEPGFRAFLETMNRWYNEGWIDNEFASLTRKNIDAKMTSDISGAYIGYLGSQMGNYLNAKKQENPRYNLVGTPWPVGPAGKPYCGLEGMTQLMTNGYGSAISTKNKHIAETVKLFDYSYSEKGTVLQNWGIEGESYTKEGGVYRFTDVILKNPEGKDPVKAMAKFALPSYGGWGKVIAKDSYLSLTQVYQSQKDAAATWAAADMSLLMPSLAFTDEEFEEVSGVMGDISTYESEIIVKIIMGTEPISKFDEFLAKIKDMGIEKAIKARKTAYDRYMAQ